MNRLGRRIVPTAAAPAPRTAPPSPVVAGLIPATHACPAAAQGVGARPEAGRDGLGLGFLLLGLGGRRLGFGGGGADGDVR